MIIHKSFSLLCFEISINFKILTLLIEVFLILFNQTLKVFLPLIFGFTTASIKEVAFCLSILLLFLFSLWREE